MKLQSAQSLADIASILGYSPSRLSYIVYKIPTSAKYSEFEIPKRGGGVRRIFAPTPKLKMLQQKVANLLYDYLDELNVDATHRPLAHGFSRSLSIVSNANVHKNRRYVLNLDLKDFFPSINFGRVRGTLIKDRRFALHEKVATVISQIACYDNALPQGSPCSPVLSNIVAHILDIRLANLAKKHKCMYSRYADDITFSTNQKIFPELLAAADDQVPNMWILGQDLASKIDRSGFQINAAKTRMQFRGSRQTVTGLTVNIRPNIRAEYYRAVRSMCHLLFQSGAYYRKVPATLSGGERGDPSIREDLTSLLPLEGMLNHIYHIRNLVDQRASAQKKKEATSTRKLYHRFMFFKTFVNLDKPLIVTEGKSDIVYLHSAIRKLPKYHPDLAHMDNGKIQYAVKMFNFTAIAHDILQLGGGTGDLKYLIINYRKLVGQFRYRPMRFPVIILIDNDDGAVDIFSIAKNMVGAISHTSNEKFYLLCHNLYLIKTPEGAPPDIKTCIENLFQNNLLATTLGGNKFDPNRKEGDVGTYGKIRFAESVVRPNVDNINFDGFDGLLDRIKAALEHFRLNKK